MSDQTPEVEVDESAEVVLDPAEMTEDQLLAREGELKSAIAELDDEPKTLDAAQRKNELRAERNIVVETVNSLRTLDDVPAIEVEDITVSDAAEAVSEEVEEEVAEESTGSEATVESTDSAAEVSEAPEAELTGTTETEAEVSTTDNEIMAAAEDAIDGGSHVASTERPVAPTVVRPTVAYVAGAGQSAFAQGVALDDYAALAEAWESRRTTIKPDSTGGQARAVVASLPSFDSTPGLEVESLSRNNSTTHNDALIAESVAAWEAKQAGAEMAPHTAAICDPLDIIREIPEDGNNSTPFSDLFPSRPASRLGFTYTPASALSVAASGVTVWEQSDQDSVDDTDPSTWKPAVHIECSSTVEVKAKELVTAATVDTNTEMSSPERVREFMGKLATARARAREQHMLGLFDATAATYSQANVNTEGTVIAIVRAVLQLLPVLTYGERINEQSYQLVLEPGTSQKLALDNVAVGQKESVANALAFITAETGLSTVQLSDFGVGGNAFTTAVQAAGGSDVIDVLPGVDRLRLVPAGDYLYSATGEQSTGWQTDPQLARQNRMQAFSAEWLLLAKHGVAPAGILDVTSVATGIRTAAV